MKNFIYLLLLAVSWPSLAQRLFDIELIVFKRNIDPEQVSESWPEQGQPIDQTYAISLYDAEAVQARGIQRMPDSQFELKAQYQKLDAHAGFTPLAHMGWRQGDLSRKQAPTLLVKGGTNYADRFNPDGSLLVQEEIAAEPEPTPFNEMTIDEIEAQLSSDDIALSEQSADIPQDLSDSNIPSLHELDGTLKVYVQHYLFADFDLDLRHPSRREVVVGTELAADSELTQGDIDTIEPVNGEAAPSLEQTEDNVQVGHLQALERQIEVEEYLKSYRFTQKRRMRSGEVHYLDHPLMGIIIQVRRIDLEDTAVDLSDSLFIPVDLLKSEEALTPEAIAELLAPGGDELSLEQTISDESAVEAQPANAEQALPITEEPSLDVTEVIEVPTTTEAPQAEVELAPATLTDGA